MKLPLACLAALFLIAAQARGATIVVDPNSKPLSEVLATSRAAKKPVTIYLHGGTYFLDKPLVLDSRDNGLTIAAYRNEKPVISGGRQIIGWKRDRDNLWSANVPAGVEFRELWVNSQRRTRARHPNTGYFAVEHAEQTPQWTDGQTQFVFRAGDVRAWPSVTNAEVVTMTRWVESRLPVVGVDESNRVVRFSRRNVFQLQPGDLYYIENVFEALDAPGEWYFDRAAGKLFYWPMPGENLAAAEVIAPVLPQLVRMDGTKNLTFRGVIFANAEWYYPPEFKADWPKPDIGGFKQAAQGVPGAVFGEGLKSCRFENCRFEHLGAYGLELGRGCQKNVVTGCEFSDLGAGGVKIGTTKIDDDPAFGNEITGCRIHDGGKLFHQAVGVWIGQSYANLIAHSSIHDFYYTGISIGWTWGYKASLAYSNVVAFNEIHHIGKLSNGDGPILSDMAGIYTLGKQPGTVIRNNVWHDIAALLYGGWGIYFDEGSSDIVAEKNLVYRTTHGGFHQHYGENNIVRNNIFAFGRDQQLQRTRVENHLSFTFERNIIYWNSGKLYAGDWSKNVQVASNLYWRADGKFTNPKLLVANPLFVAPEKGDYRLRWHSPAFKVGFQPFEMPVCPR